MTANLPNVRFTSESGHQNSVAKCPLCAKSGHLKPTGIPWSTGGKTTGA
jgi:hypothetical protein